MKFGRIYSDEGRWEEAEKLEAEVMETRKTKLEADHPDTLTSMANLASTFWKFHHLYYFSTVMLNWWYNFDGEKVGIQSCYSCPELGEYIGFFL